MDIAENQEWMSSPSENVYREKNRDSLKGKDRGTGRALEKKGNKKESMK